MALTQRIAFIGAGNMASALIQGSPVSVRSRLSRRNMSRTPYVIRFSKPTNKAMPSHDKTNTLGSTCRFST